LRTRVKGVTQDVCLAMPRSLGRQTRASAGSADLNLPAGSGSSHARCRHVGGNLGSTIPLAPGPGNLEPMSWAWLHSIYGFLGVIATLAGVAVPINWLIKRWRATRHPEVTPVCSPPPMAQPAPSIIMVPPANTGGAVSTFGLPVASAPVIPITNGPNMFNLTGQPAQSEVIRVSDSDFAFARD
jgi:hypothetical protein